MDEKIVKEILDTLFSSLEETDARSTAALQFLKDKGLATDQELAPTLKQAENSASVRWRAARARIDYLLAGVMREEEKPAETKPAQPAQDPKAEANTKEKDETDQPENNKENQENSKQPVAEEKAAPPPSKD
jgi:hypothetical protein